MTPKATDRLDPVTRQPLTEHEAMERLVGLDAAVVELDRHIASTAIHLAELEQERLERQAQIRALIRVPTYAATPLFDGDPT